MKARSLGSTRLRALVVLLAVALGSGFALERVWQAEPPRARLSARRPAAQRVEARDADRDCLALAAAVAALPQPTLPAIDQPELRFQLLGRTKSVPLLFLSQPEPASDSALATELRRSLESSPGYATFNAVIGKVRKNPELARAVFLREGYLYTEIPELAALYGSLTLPLLFRDPELRIARGDQELRARRLEDGDYEYVSGAERGQRARLLLFDRVAKSGASFTAPRHVDVREVAGRLGFDQLLVSAVGDGQLLIDARYGELSVPTLLRVDRGSISLVCEAPGAARGELVARRQASARARRAHARLGAVIQEQIDEALPFDEPKTEDGQQDGKLRPEWRTAYLKGSASFEFNGDRYAVFDASGRPRPPQVCIDFVLDTFERAGGSWWNPRGEPRARGPGRLRFDSSSLENRRSVERFIDYARAHPEAFDVYDQPAEARVPFRSRAQFFSALYRARSEFRPGDIVAILGPRDDEKLHYHSFIIVAADPVSGAPIELAANAGRPRIRSWEGELSSAPRRSIVARVRPKQVWLESFLALEAGVSAEEAPPALGPDAKEPAAG